MTDAITHTLAEFAATLDIADVSADAHHATVRTLTNGIALAVGAAHHPSVELTLGVQRQLGSQPTLALIGREERLGVFGAPLVNGMAIHVEDYDDTHLRTVVHPAAPILPAVLGAAQLAGASGADAMSGLLAGVEVALRVANGICPEHFDLGWHLTGTAGHIGAAAAASRVLGLDADQTVVALALGATQAAGLTAANGTMTKGFHPGKAAADGLEAALLAQAGLTGPARPIEGRRGFAPVASPKVDLDEMVDALGTRWEMQDNAIKPYACGIVSHAAIDAAIALRERVSPDEIDHLEARIAKVVLEVMGIEDPRDGLQSKFSVHHCVTVGLLDGDGAPPQFSDARAVAPDVVALRGRVRAVIDPDVPKGAVWLCARTTDGREIIEEVRHATASAERPMTDEQLERKVQGLTVPVLGEHGAVDLWRRCAGLGADEDVEALLAATRPV